MNIGENIKLLRNKKGLTQEELANKCGLSKNGLWNYENNKRQPTTKVLEKIATGLDVDLLTLMSDNNDMIEQKDLNRLKKEVKDKRLIYHKSSVIKEMDEQSKLYECIQDILTNKFLQKEFNYDYFRLVSYEDFDEISEFVLEMLKMKIIEIKSRKK